MRFTIPFLLALVVAVATIVGANQTSLSPETGSLTDLRSAADAIAFRLERAFDVPPRTALAIGAVALALPALLTFHLFRIGFGGSVPSILQDEHVRRRMSAERDRSEAAKFTTAPADLKAPAQRAQTAAHSSGDVPMSPAREGAGNAASQPSGAKSPGLGANIAAALSGKRAQDAPSQNATPQASGLAGGSASGSTSGTTALAGDVQRPAADTGTDAPSGGIKDRWNTMLENRPDLSRLKTSAQSLRQKIGGNGKPANLADLSDDSSKS